MCATAVAEMTFSGDRTGGAKPEANLNCPVRFQHAALSHCLLYCGSPLLLLLRSDFVRLSMGYSVVHFPPFAVQLA